MRTENAASAADARFSPTPFDLDELSEAFDVFEATVAGIAAEDIRARLRMSYL